MNDTLSTLKKEFNKETNKPINNSDKNPKMDVKKEIVRTKDKPMPSHTNKKESVLSFSFEILPSTLTFLGVHKKVPPPIFCILPPIA